MMDPNLSKYRKTLAQQNSGDYRDITLGQGADPTIDAQNAHTPLQESQVLKRYNQTSSQVFLGNTKGLANRTGIPHVADVSDCDSPLPRQHSTQRRQ